MGDPSPGADVAWGEPSPGKDVTGGARSRRRCGWQGAAPAPAWTLFRSSLSRALSAVVERPEAKACEQRRWLLAALERLDARRELAVLDLQRSRPERNGPSRKLPKRETCPTRESSRVEMGLSGNLPKWESA
jgi:hypothetical protein